MLHKRPRCCPACASTPHEVPGSVGRGMGVISGDAVAIIPVHLDPASFLLWKRGPRLGQWECGPPERRTTRISIPPKAPRGQTNCAQTPEGAKGNLTNNAFEFTNEYHIHVVCLTEKFPTRCGVSFSRWQLCILHTSYPTEHKHQKQGRKATI